MGDDHGGDDVAELPCVLRRCVLRQGSCVVAGARRLARLPARQERVDDVNDYPRALTQD
jgi:hypothetical protein